MSASKANEFRLLPRHVIGFVALGLLIAGVIWRYGYSFRLVTYTMAGGVVWYLVSEWRAYRRQEAAAAVFVQNSKLELDSAGKTDHDGLLSGGEIWWCYRGLFEGARIKWIKGWIGSARRGRTVWIAATEIFPAFEQTFRVAASGTSFTVPTNHPRLPTGRNISCEPAGWVADWLDSLPAATADALRAFFDQNRRAGITGRTIFCSVENLGTEGAAAVHATFRELIALARLLSASASETNSYDIHTSFHYVRYQEGKNTLELTVDPGETAAWVYVPSAENWPRRVPHWAAGRRDVIVPRLLTHLDASRYRFIEGA